MGCAGLFSIGIPPPGCTDQQGISLLLAALPEAPVRWHRGYWHRCSGTAPLAILLPRGADRQSGAPFDYSIGKAARHSLIKSLAASEIQNGITCNIIAPGPIPHITLRQAVESAKHSSSWKRRTNAQPQDVGEVVRFLCCEEFPRNAAHLRQDDKKSGLAGCPRQFRR